MELIAMKDLSADIRKKAAKNIEVSEKDVKDGKIIPIEPFIFYNPTGQVYNGQVEIGKFHFSVEILDNLKKQQRKVESVHRLW